MERSDAPRRGTRTRTLIGVSILLVGLCAYGATKFFGPTSPRSTPESLPSPVQFTERTHDAGINFTYRNDTEAGHAAIVESLGGGTGVLDYDNDGDLDIVFVGGGRYDSERNLLGLPCALYRNEGGWKYTDVTAFARTEAAGHYSHGVASADYDQDGFQDLLVTGHGGVQLLRNQGDGTFQDVTQAAQLTDTSWSSSAGWGDVNGDGHLDLYVAHYVNWSWENHPLCKGPTPEQREVCPPREFEGLPDTLYLSNGDGTFRDVSEEYGLMKDGKGLGVMLADVDLDGDLDIYVCNDTVANFLYDNDGQGHLKERGMESGTAVGDMGTPDGSMGVALCDFNQDGLPDVWVANYEQESFALYKNLGNCNFQHVSQMLGITSVGQLYVGFGTVFLDFDRDGDEDIFVTNGHVIKFPGNSPVRQVPLLMENQGGTRFVNLASTAGEYMSSPHLGRGVAKGDFDGDGDLDLVVSHTNEPESVLENVTPTENGWLKVRLIGVQSNRNAIGARLTLETSAGTQIRQITGGGSYLSQSDLEVYWGIPQGAKIHSLSIVWPSGIKQSFPHVSRNTVWKLIEPPQSS